MEITIYVHRGRPKSNAPWKIFVFELKNKGNGKRKWLQYLMLLCEPFVWWLLLH